MRAERWAAVAGGAFALAALAPPVDAAAESSLVAHMVQHLVLVTVAAPLLGFGLPLPCGRRAWAAWAVAAVAASSAVLWAWHAPGLFDAAVSHAPVHGAEHLTMLGTAVVLWSVVAGPGRRHRSGVGVLAVLAASVPATALGAALTLAGHPWYSAYPSLDDQRVAGALMWAAGSVPGLAGGALLFAWWLSAPPPRASEA